MLVPLEKLPDIIATLSRAKHLSLDTETTGLRPYQGDLPFSIIISNGDDTFYFNLQKYPGVPEHCVLEPAALKPQLALVLGNPNITFYLHNAKFDLAMLHQLGLSIAGAVHCTEVGARLEHNDHLTYTLDACASRIGLKKDDAVKEFIKKNNLWDWEQFDGERTGDKKLYFDRVPIELIVPYAERDAEITYRIGQSQEEAFQKLATCVPEGKPSILNVRANEKQLTKTCFEMERVGVRVDLAYCHRALRFEKAQYLRAAEDFEQLTGLPFVDSGKSLQRAFESLKAGYGRTEKGNPSFTSEVLKSLPSEPGSLVLRYREHYKKAHTYYQNFLRFADADGVVHANIRQAGTAPGRFSYSDPNLQNLHKEEGDETLAQEFVIRRAVIPRPGYFFAMIDYQAMEYRLMLDYAGERELIAKVLSGLDVHTATGAMMGVSRKHAKTVNFMLLYGGGAQKLADSLGISLDRARELRNLYFRTLPNVRDFIQQVGRAAELRGWVRNWAGRVYQFPKAEFSYKAPNYLIQGGCADVVKIAMNHLAEYLSDKKSRMLLQIHDEILFEVHESEAHILPDLKRIMESAYPYKYLPLTCEVMTSKKSWADKEAYPILTE